MTDADRIDALLDLVDPERAPLEGRGAQLTVLGLASASARKGVYRPTNAGWVLLGEQGRRFQPTW